MSFNLIDRIKGVINDEAINLISRAVHGTDGQTQAAIDSTLSGLLNNLLSLTSSKLGTEALFNAINDQDDAILDRLPDELVGENHKSLANSGSFSLNSLLGIRGIKRLTHSVSVSSGLSQNASSSLLGILLPIVLAVIRRKLVKDEKLNSPGVVSLLKGQIDIIKEALPTGFHEENDISEEIEQHSSLLEEPMILESERASSPYEKHKKYKKLVVPLLLLLALAAVFFLYHWGAKKADEPMSLPSEQTVSGIVLNDKLNEAEQSAIRELNSIFDTIAALLSEITNTETAKAQLPQLEQAAKSIAKLGQSMQTMSADAKAQAANLVGTRLPELQMILDRIDRVPGALAIIDPVIDKIIQQLVDTFI